jgi:nucleotide-binding universal stress UspA family protein
MVKEKEEEEEEEEEEEDRCSREATQSKIVVGVDGSPTSFSALEWAAREACLRGSTLEVVHSTFLHQDALELDSSAWLKARENAILDEAVTKASALAPGIVVVRRLGDPPAADLLVDVSKSAELLVVGSRGLGPFKAFTLGSVSQDCSRHARCPLVIVGPRTVRGEAVTDKAAWQGSGGTRP